LRNKTGSHVDEPCSSPDSNLESGEERYLFRIGAPNSKIPALSFPYSKRSSPASNFGIQRGARSFSMKTGFITPNFNFEKSQELNGRSEK
jgi:hypothetical protein